MTTLSAPPNEMIVKSKFQKNKNENIGTINGTTNLKQNASRYRYMLNNILYLCVLFEITKNNPGQ